MYFEYEFTLPLCTHNAKLDMPCVAHIEGDAGRWLVHDIIIGQESADALKLHLAIEEELTTVHFDRITAELAADEQDRADYERESARDAALDNRERMQGCRNAWWSVT